MFVAMAFVAAANTVGRRAAAVGVDDERGVRQRRRLDRGYALVATTMAGTLVAAGVYKLGALGLWQEWDYWVLVVEVVMLSAFAGFWGLQTWEFWHEGPPPEGTVVAQVEPGLTGAVQRVGLRTAQILGDGPLPTADPSP